MELCDQPIHLLHQRREAGEVSTVEIARSVLARLEKTESLLHAFITPTPEGVAAAAELADRALAAGEAISPIAGMPLALKDLFVTKGIPTTCGSRILQDFVPPYDATVVERLRGAGLNLVGKANMDEFAMGSSTENSAYGVTRNPWDPTIVPGGSSGGSAVAVAAGEALASIGTDTGGSIRQPAAYNSLVGLKPTYGRVSRYGMVAYASSLDQAGPITRDVRDAAILIQIISGHDPRDATSARQPVPDFNALPPDGLKGKKVGLVKEFQGKNLLEPSVAAAFEKNLASLKDAGAELVEISLPTMEYAIPVFYILAMSEASSNLGRFDGVRFGPRQQAAGGIHEMFRATREAGFGAEVKRRIMLGTFALSSGYYDAYYGRAHQIRGMIRGDFATAFQQVDLIASPTSPVPPFKLGEKVADPLQMYMVDALTVPANLAGLPGISIPGGFTPGGLPLGLQLLAPHWREADLLNAALAFEQTTDHHQRRAPVG